MCLFICCPFESMNVNIGRDKMAQICECYKKIKYMDSHYDIEGELEEREEYIDYKRSSSYETENIFRLPGVLHIDDSKSEYPIVQESCVPHLFQEISDIIKEVRDYEFNILSFWIIDIILEGLRTVQIEQMSHRNQKATLHWIVYLYNLIQGSGRKLTRKDIFLKIKYFLLAPDMDVDSDDKNETNDAKKVSENKCWYVPFPPAWRIQDDTSRTFLQNEVGQVVYERNDSAELIREENDFYSDKNIRDMETILEILYRTFARLWSFKLIQTCIRSPPKVEIVDLPFHLNVPKQVVKYENFLPNKSDKFGRKAQSLKNLDDAPGRKESKNLYILPLQAAEGMDSFLRDLFALPLYDSSNAEREKGKIEKKKNTFAVPTYNWDQVLNLDMSKIRIPTVKTCDLDMRHKKSKISSEPKVDGSGSEAEQSQKRRSFTHDEDMAILSYILEDDRYLQSSGNKIWKLAEEQGICPGRGFWSLKERYRKTIVRNIFKYPIERKLAFRLIQFSTANAKGKAKIRHKLQINSRLMYPDIELVEEEPAVWCKQRLLEINTPEEEACDVSSDDDS